MWFWWYNFRLRHRLDRYRQVSPGRWEPTLVGRVELRLKVWKGAVARAFGVRRGVTIVDRRGMLSDCGVSAVERNILLPTDWCEAVSREAEKTGVTSETWMGNAIEDGLKRRKAL